jgi:hypothetical protein
VPFESRMNKCSACGKILPDSQTACDCTAASRRAEPEPNDEGQSDEKTPIFAGISFLLTVAVEFLILRLKDELPHAELAAPAVGFGMILRILSWLISRNVVAKVGAGDRLPSELPSGSPLSPRPLSNGICEVQPAFVY